tara:strand:+ start:43 stop:2052 length:2010 start_codon:yes stop_codon:yes gene_type:complete
VAKITSAGLNGLIDKAKWPEYKKGKMFLPENKYSQSEKTQIKNLIKPILSLGKEWMAFDKDGKALSLKNWPNMIVKGDDRDIEKFILRAPYEVVEDILFQYGSDNTYSPIKDTIKADKNSPGQKPAGHHPDTIENGDKWDIVTLKFRDQPITFIPSTDKETIPGPTIDATTMTAIQEMASAYIFKRAIKDNAKLTSPKEIRENDNGKDFKELVKIWMDVGGGKVKNETEAKNSIDSGGWLENFAKQNEKLLDKVRGNKFTIFTRGQTQGYTADWYDQGETFMEWVSKQVKDRFDISKKDNWNPADVWLIEDATQAKNKILDAMKGPTTSKAEGVVSANLNQFNAIFRDLFKKKKVMGISLKKISGGVANWKPVNTTEEFFTTIEATEMEYVSAKCKFGPKLGYEKIKDASGTYQKIVAGVTAKQSERATRIKNGKPPQNPLTKAGAFTLETQETMMTVKDKASNKTYEIQIKSNNSADFDNLKYEPKDTAASSARLGKATGEYVDDLVKFYGIQNWKKRWQEYPQSRDNPSDRQKQQAFDDWKYFYPQDATNAKAVKEWEKTYNELAKEAQGSKPFNSAEKKDYLSMIKFIKQQGVDIGDVTPEEAVANLDEAFYRRSNRWVANSKCMQVQWLFNFLNLSKENRNKLATDIIFLAEKAGRRYGPYGKLY